MHFSSSYMKERIKAETTGMFESSNFRHTLMGLLTKREEQIAVYLKAGPGKHRSPHLAIPLDLLQETSKGVSMTWRAMSLAGN
jgi:hypothetical protein